MEFLGTPDINALTFAGLMLASLVTCFIGVFTGAAGGIVLLGLMATVMPPLALIPVHTVVMLGSGVTRTMIHVASRHASGGTALHHRRHDRSGGKGVRRADNGVAGVHPRRLHPAHDVDN
jgi:hypothetical protein